MTLVLAMPGAVEPAREIGARLGARSASVNVHEFPDGEHRVRVIESLVEGDVLIVAALDRPDGKLLPLVFTADLVRELGATRVGLVAPYIPYMRQDFRFQPGEAVSSRSFARLVSASFDFVVTAEPHLHRWHSLGDVFGIETRAVSAARPMAEWIGEHVKAPVLIGPDEESRQWVERIAAELGAPFAVMDKVREGDRQVRIALPASGIPAGTPVIVDDIVSTGRTVLAATQALRDAGRPAQACVCVHALMGNDVLAQLAQAGLSVASCDTVVHRTNAIAMAPALAAACASLLSAQPAAREGEGMPAVDMAPA